MLVIIGLSIDMRWGSPYGQFIPLLLLLLSFREILKAQKVIVGKDEDKDLFTAQVAGKNYWLESLAEEQQASDAIARLLRFNYASVPKDEDIEDEGLAGALGDEEIDVNVDVEPAVPESVEDL